MSSGRRSDGLLGIQTTLAMIEMIARRGEYASVSRISRSLAALHGSPRLNTENTLCLLSDLGLLSINDDVISEKRNVLKRDPRTVLARAGLNYLLTECWSDAVAGAFEWNPETGTLWADSKRLPGRSIGLPFFLLEFQVFSRDRLTVRHWRVADSFAGEILDAIHRVNWNFRSSNPANLESLKLKMAAQEEAGLRAEQWVVEYERARLVGHPMIDEIKRISEEDVSAGYDILSFSSVAALRYDRFVEVKSYIDSPSFYWTDNEANAAKILAEQYHIYLVDRNAMHAAGYNPIIISGPYSYFFGDERKGWSRMCFTHRFNYENPKSLDIDH